MAYDRWTSLFWLVLSVGACVKSVFLGIGAPNKPGPGLFPFGASVGLGILSAGLFIQAMIKKGEAREESLFAGKNWGRILFIILAIVIYANILPLMGYLVTTFFLMLFVFWLAEMKKWYGILFSSLAITWVSHLVFAVWLKCQLPPGILRF
jgi:putative tricarboxylic transport membrane protein